MHCALCIKKRMDLLLPKRIDGKQSTILRDTRQITIIGANGSGKSRFCNQIIKECADKAYRISALKALFPIQSTEKPLPGSIDAMFNHINETSHQVKNSADTEFDKLAYIMLIDEFRELMNYKAHQLKLENPAVTREKPRGSPAIAR